MDKDTIASIRSELASLRKEVEELRNKRVTQDQILPDSIKMRAVGEGVRYVRGGVTASRPTSGEEPLQGQAVYFDTTLGKLSIWNDSSWVDFVRVPSSPSAFVQTYSTANRTIANLTATALTHSVGTADGTVDDVGAAFNQTTLNNNFKELTAQIANLVADVLDIKQGQTAVIDDLQSAGIVS